MESVSEATSGSLVSKKARLPSCDTPFQMGMNAPLPLIGPVETCVVEPPVWS